jgi:hypothetical protein
MPIPLYHFKRLGRGRKRKIPPLGAGPILYFLALSALAAFVGLVVEAHLR